MQNLKIRQALNSDTPDLKTLWHICFGDEMSYINLFFDNMFVAQNTVVAEIGCRVVGVVHILKRKLNNKTFLYGYAVGVLPEARGNNICKAMLDKIKEYCCKNNVLFGLHPANEKLCTFYKRIGLNEMYSLKEVDATQFFGDKDYVLCDITEDEFYDMRIKSFKNSVEWDKNALGYMLKSGETVKKIDIDGNVRYFVLSKNNAVVTVKETTADDNEIKKVTTSIKKYFDAKNVRYFLSSKSTLQGVVKPVVYGFSEKDDNIYMNLFLD